MSEVLTAGRGGRQLILDLVGAQLVLHAAFGGDPPVVGERWAIEAILGSGGFGVVFRARNLRLQRTVALKLYALDEDDAELRSAMREARSLARLDHPAIVAVHAVDEDELIAGEQRLRCALVEMQLVDGEALPQWLRSAPREPTAVLGVLIGAGRALAYAHDQGLVHRDFKPDNVMIDRAGQPKVIDFGLALVAHASGKAGAVPWSSRADALGTRETVTGGLRGTPGYMAPELAQRKPSAASDQFAFAVVVEELLSGLRPLADARSPTSRGRAAGRVLLQRVRPLLARAMATDPADRFRSMEALCHALEDELRREGDPAVATAPLTRRAWGVGLGGIGLGVVAVTVVGVPRCDGTADVPRADTQHEPTANSRAERSSAVDACPNLTRFDGQWRTTVRILWSESASQQRLLHYVLGLAAASDCSFVVQAERLSDRLDEPPRATFSTTTRASVTPGPNGTWLASMRLTFPGDDRLYGVPEHDELLLVLESGSGHELVGAYRRTDDAGLRLSRGLALAGPDAALAAEHLAALAPSCAATCWIECAGDDAERACRAGSCVPYADDPRDPCGPIDGEFVAPLQAGIALATVHQGGSLIPDQAELHRRCEANAAKLTGAWGVWRGTGRDAELFSLELAADGCRIRGELRAPEDAAAIAVVGEVSPLGVWTIQAVDQNPRMSSAWALVGTAPAFGLDAGTPAAKLRAYAGSR